MIKNSSWAIDDVGQIRTSTLVESSVKCEVNLWVYKKPQQKGKDGDVCESKSLW